MRFAATIYMTVEPKHTEAILREMCQRVGADYDGFDFEQPEWYTLHEWTEAEEQAFIDWCAKYFTRHRLTTVARGKREACKLAVFYGWKIK